MRCYTSANTLDRLRRLLGPLERQIVMNLLWLESAIPAATMAAWVPQESRQYAAVHLLTPRVHVSLALGRTSTRCPYYLGSTYSHGLRQGSP